MSFRKVGAHPIGLAGGVGIAIKVTDPAIPGMHVGILYEREPGKTWFLHLARHHALGHQEGLRDASYYWDDCAWMCDGGYVGIGDHVRKILMTIAEDKKIAYSIDTATDLFDPTGKKIVIDNLKGATCATFVALAFKASGCPVVDLDSWRSRPEDAAWRDHTLAMLKQHDPDRHDDLKDVDSLYRLWPHEVAAAATQGAVPLRFSRAHVVSKPLYDLLMRDHPAYGPGSVNGAAMPY